MYTLFILLEFEKWKHEIEDKHKCQFIKRTSTKKVNGIEYSYYYCHRSFYPRISGKVRKLIRKSYLNNHVNLNQGKRSLKNGGSVKIGKICPSYIKLHKKDNQLIVEYSNTHLWHQNEIGKLRLNTADRAKLAGILFYFTIFYLVYTQ